MTNDLVLREQFLEIVAVKLYLGFVEPSFKCFLEFFDKPSDGVFKVSLENNAEETLEDVLKDLMDLLVLDPESKIRNFFTFLL
jgi:hypothetical protein